MNKINFEEVYFHGLDVMNWKREKPNYECSILRLESILQVGYILSKSMQKQLNTREIKNIELMNCNGNDYISICTKMSNTYYIGISTAYEMFVRDGMSLILNKEIDKKLQIRGGLYQRMSGEVQVKDKISTKYIEGIGININPYFEDSKMVVKRVNDLLKKYDMNIPIYNITDNNKVLVR